MSEKYIPRFFYKENPNGQNEYLKKFAARVSFPDRQAKTISSTDTIQVRGVDAPKF